MRKNLSRKFFAAGVIIFIVTLFVCVVLIGVKLKRQTFFDQEEWFYVYANSSTKENLMEKQSEQIKLLGGAGIVTCVEGKFFLIVSVYQTREDAEEIAEKLKNKFAGAGVLPLLSARISGAEKRQIKANPESFWLIKNFANLRFSAADFAAGFASETDASEFVYEVLGSKLELSEKLNCYEAKSGLEKNLSRFMTMVKLALDRFLTEFYSSPIKQSEVWQLAVCLSLLRREMSNYLTK